MTRDPERLPVDAMVSEDAAHRVLARAVELDTHLSTQVSIAQLREVAREAGIAPAAFDEALREFRVEQARLAGAEAGFFQKFWGSSKESKWQSLTSNLTAFAAFAVLIIAVGRTNRALDWNWQTYHAMQILATATVAAVSVKHRARIAALFFGTMTVAQLAGYVMHLVFGIHTVQGGPTHWALILASLLGIGAGALLLHSRKVSGNTPPNAATKPVDAAAFDDVGPERRPPASLILRPA